MADNGDPLLDILGYRDISSGGATLPRRSTINVVGGSATDNPTLGATDINVGGGAGSQTLAQTLVLGNLTDGEDIILEQGSIIAGIAEPTGFSVIFRGGQGTAGAGGSARVASGSGSTVSGDVNFEIPALSDDVTFNWEMGGSSFLQLGQFSSVPSNGSAAGLLIAEGLGQNFTFGFQDDTSAFGRSLSIVSQSSSVSVGGDCTIHSGDGGGGTGGQMNVRGGDGTTAGGPASMRSGAGTSGNAGGGAVDITGGDGFGTGNGGTAEMQGGSGGAGASTGGGAQLSGGSGATGGAVTVTAGASSSGSGPDTIVTGGEGSTIGGDTRINGGRGLGSGGGEVRVLGGLGATSGGLASFTGGQGLAGPGGAATIVGGQAAAGSGGASSMTGGQGLAGSGGGVSMIAGAGTGSGADALVQSADSATGSAGDVNLTGGEATAGSGDGGNIILTPGTSSGGDGGTVAFVMPGSSTYIWPAADGSASDVLSTNGSGVMTWVAPGGGGGGSLADALIIGNTSGPNDILLDGGRAVRGTPATTGADAFFVGGDGTAGAGGDALFFGGDGTTNGGAATLSGGEGAAGDGGMADVTGGTGNGTGDGGIARVSGGPASGSGNAGVVEFNIDADVAGRNYKFSLGSGFNEFAELGQLLPADQPVTSSAHGFYVAKELANDFAFGHEVQDAAATNGRDLFVQGQQAADGQGGGATVYGGRGTTAGGLAGCIGGEGTAGAGGGAGLIGGQGSTVGGLADIRGGAGMGGDGGDVRLLSGSGSVDSGGIVFDIPAWSDSGRIVLRENGSDRVTIGAAVSATPTSGTTNGFYVDDSAGAFSFGYYDKVGAGNGSDLHLMAQTGDADDGGDVFIIGGSSTSGNPGLVKLFSAGRVYDVSTDGEELDTQAKPICEAINELATGGGNIFGTVTTVNATPVTLAGFGILTDNSVSMVCVKVLARDVTSGDRATWDITVTVARDGSSVVTVIDTDIRHVFKDDATWDVTFSVTAQAVNILATGDATNNTKFQILGTSVEAV